MAANKDAVDGTKVSGSTNISAGADSQNGAVAALADDVASINAANANRVPIARGTDAGWGKVYGGLPGGSKDGGY